MLSAEIVDIIAAARNHGWVLEPEALRLLRAAGVPVPRFAWPNPKRMRARPPPASATRW